MDQTKVLVLGGCLLHGPMNVLLKAKQRIARPRVSSGTGTPGVYTFGEMLQMLALFRGETDIPLEIRPLLGMSAAFKPLPGAARLDDVDVVLVEPSSPIEIMYEGYYLHRAAVAAAVTIPLKDIHARISDKDKARQVAKATSAWLSKGVIACDPEVQAEAAKVLIPAVPDDMPLAELARSVLLNARGVPLDAEQSFRTLRRQIDAPLGLVSFMFQYMPDGRAVSWPAHFRETVVSVAEDLGIPIFEPWRLVQQHGVATAMKPDLRHYRDEFIPTVAAALEAFALEIHEGARRQILPAA